MNRVSVNGILKPADDSTISDEYLGHFLKVSYIQNIAGNSVFSKDRIEVTGSGHFRFYLPKGELLARKEVTIEVYAPDGELRGAQTFSYGSLHASVTADTAADDTQPLVIVIDPKVVEFGALGPVLHSSQKVSGRVVDLSGENKAASLQIVIYASDDANAEFSRDSYQAIFASQTNQEGYFYGQVDYREHQRAYGVIAGLENAPILIKLDEKRIPKHVLLVADLSALPDERTSASGTPTLPDAADLVGNGSFSQDVGGRCVDFTIPNRTLEEFSFYHTVRTTEPEIRGLTITGKESKNIKSELVDISDALLPLFGKLNASLKGLNLISYSVDEEKTTAAIAESSAAVKSAKRDEAGDAPKPSLAGPAYPVYHLKVATGTTMLNLASDNLLHAAQGLDFPAILKILAEQSKRKTRLQELHFKLAAAYCGKSGAQETETYCASYAAKDALNRATVDAILGHVRKYTGTAGRALFTDPGLTKQLADYADDLDSLMEQPFVDSGLIAVMKRRLEKLIQTVDTSTTESQDQEELLGYMRRLISELAEAGDKHAFNFEPCPPGRETQNMGIICILQQFDNLKDTLRNKAVFTLGEILSIRANYDAYVSSINAFLGLLDEFYAFYKSSIGFLVTLDDDYFVEHYDSIKATLLRLKQQIYTAINRIEAIERAYLSNHPGRRELTVESSIDWDETPTVYENTTIAHGHILHFKQKWKADGYSLGDLLYSLPLAPCQEKQIAIVDWDRREEAVRTEKQMVTESLAANLSRDRDISEIIRTSFNENISARSTNDTSSTSSGFGLAGGIGGFSGTIGGFLGIGGGVAHSGASSTSTANQNSARNLSGSSLNRLQDNVSQSASSVRNNRSTVIQTVGQNEVVSVQTEVIKNNNHCHAMTVEYFEVLKHYAIEQELVDVQECLFVPLPMEHFDYPKILRWKNTLRRAVFGRKLQRGFDAVERISNQYANSDFPSGRYADEDVEYINGYFTISFELTRPFISAIEEETKTETIELNTFFPWFFGVMKFNIDRPLTEAEKDALFEAEYAPDIVRGFIDKVRIYAIAEDGEEIPLDLDYTQVTNYRRGVALKVNFVSRAVQSITRRQIKYLRFSAATSVHASSKILLRSLYMYYRTPHLNHAVYRNPRVNNDVMNHVEIGSGTALEIRTDAALLYTPLSDKELADPRKEDREAAEALASFLNEHLEMAHKVIWSNMDSSRLFGLLDGYVAPNASGKSVASVVESRIMGVVGNNLVLKVVPGVRLDPVFRHVEDLFAHYQPTTAPEPFRISLPTKGVYAESVMGKCNSCEEIDDTRHWRFRDEPCGSTPTPIDPAALATRRADPGDLHVKDLPTNLVNIQSAPEAPTPTGLGAAFTLLGKSDAFRDLTGLAGTQANAIKALETTAKSVTDLTKIAQESGSAAMSSTLDFIKQSANKKDIAKTLKTIQSAVDSEQITPEQGNKLALTALGSLAGEPSSKPVPTDEVKEIVKAAGENKAKVSVPGPSGTVDVDARPSASAEDSPHGAVIVLPTTENAPDSRAFFPSRDDKSGVIEVAAEVRHAPADASHRWSASDAAALTIDSREALRTRVRGLKPGLQELDFTVRDSGGSALASQKLRLSVPQFVTVDEDAAAFDGVLSGWGIDSHKNEILREAKAVCDHLLATVNVRLVWLLAPFSEALPAHLPAAHVTPATIRGEAPAGRPTLYGQTRSVAGAGGATVFNETIDVFPGAYDESGAGGPLDVEVDTQTQALAIELTSRVGAEPDLKELAVKVFGRLMGETLAHEVIHSLLWKHIHPNFHNNPPVPNDLMNSGSQRSFLQRTGIKDTAQVSPVDPINFSDLGIASIGGLQAANQARIDAVFPVPPSFT